MEMKKEKSWTLLGVWTVYIPVKEIKWEMYMTIGDFNCAVGRLQYEIDELEEEKRRLKAELLKVKDEYSDLWEKYIEMRDCVNQAYLVTLK